MFASAVFTQNREALTRYILRNCASPECNRKPGLWQLTQRVPRVRLRKTEFCFPSCFEREMLRMLEQSLVPRAYPVSRSRRIPLGLLMLSQGRLTNPELQRALSAQRDAGAGLIGEWFQKLGFADEYEVTAALAKQRSCPLIWSTGTRPGQTTGCVLPTVLLRRLNMVPVHFSKARRILHIAFAGEIDYPALVSIEQMLECKTEPCLTTPRELQSALERLDEHKRSSEKLFENCRAPEEIVRITSNYAARLDAGEVRVVRCGKLFWARALGVVHITDLLFVGNPFLGDLIHPSNLSREVGP